ncbi:MAG TPA: hypothetical protein VG095_04465 [Chthoniobacterales bacterium]|nr:hypothetical protein [Chthoniobacterales bacterium]
MNRFLLILTRECRLTRLLVVALCATHIATAGAAHSDDASADAFNLAALNGDAQIECTTPDGRVELLRPNQPSTASAALLRDQMLSCPLQEGVTTFVIKLPSTSLLDRFTFVNENAAAAGELKISVSNYQLPATSTKWLDVDGNITFSRKRLFNLSLLGVEARYVKLAFKVENAGRIGAVGLYGNTPASAFARMSKESVQFGWTEAVNEDESRKTAGDAGYDYASIKAKGRVVFVSSGQRPTSARMIDDSHETSYVFALSDRRPTAIVELAVDEQIYRVSAVYKTRTPGRFDVFLLEDNSKSSTDLNYRQPVASGEDQDGDGIVEIDFDPEGARFIAVRFTPSEAFTATNQPFELVEVNAYGNLPMAMLDVLEAPDVYTEITAATFPGESGPDISTRLGVIAVPPTLSQVSP